MKKIIGLLVITILFINCDGNKKVEGLKGNDSEVLTNWAENIIIPSYKNYQEKAVKFTSVAKSFEEAPTESNFSAVKNAWLESYKAYQKTILFNFETYNKARSNYYLEMSNTYPTSPERIEENIIKVQNGNEVDLDVTTIQSRYTYQGFPALDYLLFSRGKNLTYYETNKSARTYVRMLAENLQKSIDKIVTYWNDKKEFYTTNVDQSVTGAYSATINSFIEVYEQQIRAQKVGYACGAIPKQNGVAIPDFIEAYYKEDISKELLKISLQSSQDFFNGKNFNGNGNGRSLSEILKEIGREDLVTRINDQYDVIYKTLEGTSENLKSLAERGNSQSDFKQRPLYELYSVIQDNVGNYKTRMLNALNVQVGYQDSDGD